MQFKQFLGAALAVVAVRAQEDNSTSSGNLTTVLAGNSDLTGLVSLLQSSPDIANALSGAQNITLLAPSNDALGALNSSGLLSSSSQQGLIQGLLNYHVLVGVFVSEFNFSRFDFLALMLTPRTHPKLLKRPPSPPLFLTTQPLPMLLVGKSSNAAWLMMKSRSSPGSRTM
jgi:uncharacterized surface protein with fasciclin (FAS1) repeats